MPQQFRDLIDTGSLVLFIDDILVVIDTEKEYNKIVEEVLKRMKKNNLYMKLERCFVDFNNF